MPCKMDDLAEKIQECEQDDSATLGVTAIDEVSDNEVVAKIYYT